MENDYYIKQKHLDKLKHCLKLISYSGDSLKELCAEERSDIVYGFEIGNVTSMLNNCKIMIMSLEEDISLYLKHVDNDSNKTKYNTSGDD